MTISRPVTRLLLTFIVCADVCAAGLYVRIGLGPDHYTDREFIAYYSASRLPYQDAYDIEKQRSVEKSLGREPLEAFVNPPFVLPVLKALHGGYVESFKLWVTILAGISLACGVLLFSTLRHLQWDRSEAALASCTAILSLPMYLSVARGQLSVVMLLGALLSIWLLQRNREALGGIAASLCFVKPHTALLMAISLLKRSKAVLYLIASLAALALLSLALVGVKGLTDLAHLASYVSDYNAGGAAQARMFNFLGLMLRLGVPFGWAKSLAWLAFGLAITFGLLIRTRDRDPLAIAGIYVILAVAFSPHLHSHDLVLMAIPACALAHNLRRRGFALGVVLLPLLPLLPFLMIFVMPAN